MQQENTRELRVWERARLVPKTPHPESGVICRQIVCVMWDTQECPRLLNHHVTMSFSVTSPSVTSEPVSVSMTTHDMISVTTFPTTKTTVESLRFNFLVTCTSFFHVRKGTDRNYRIVLSSRSSSPRLRHTCDPTTRRGECSGR